MHIFLNHTYSFNELRLISYGFIECWCLQRHQFLESVGRWTSSSVAFPSPVLWNHIHNCAHHSLSDCLIQNLRAVSETNWTKCCLTPKCAAANMSLCFCPQRIYSLASPVASGIGASGICKPIWCTIAVGGKGKLLRCRKKTKTVLLRFPACVPSRNAPRVSQMPEP